ncbi:MAG: family 20 glycosylhydrolase [Fimbriimonadaceae bacterium]|nr:family 20 glycosylhydrolase [Fimbriimonadaceae bacterium]
MRRLLLLSLLGVRAVWAQAGLEGASLVRPLPPTPQGESHLGNLPSGETVELRFPLPPQPPLTLAVGLGNVVGFSGKGSSYQLVLRRDAAAGEVIHRGPVIANGDAWNQSNVAPIDLTAAVRPTDCARGYLTLFVSATVSGDGWTLYRDHDQRPIQAWVLADTPEQQAERALLAELATRRVSPLPLPREISLLAGELHLTKGSRLVLAAAAPPADREAAAELVDLIAERCGLRLTVVTSASRAGDLQLRRVTTLPADSEEHRVSVTASGVVVEASSAAGLFYGACTAGQLVRADGSLPHCRIVDRPAFPLRGLQYDVARGQTVDVAWWTRLIRLLARSKLNALMIYGENDYQFRQYPFLGRPGTFTPAKAGQLADVARRYHVQLIPQFESLGHASAVLQAPELAALREAGDPWVFCTSSPATWEFLDRVYGELREQFPAARYLHVGADEFEMNFGKCPACAAKVAAGGVGGLYTEHLQKLNQLCRRHGFTMLFWPSHHGPTPELSNMSIQYAAAMPKDSIPTEWIYHGPAAYPEIATYQQLGYADVWASPAIVSYSRLWPDHATTYRGIRGFLRAAAERGCRGAMTTTWEWMGGALAANSLLGMLYTAECSWSLGRGTTADFERRYADQILGCQDPAGRLLREVLVDPTPAAVAGAALTDQRRLNALVVCPPDRVRRDFGLKQPELVAAAKPGLMALDNALQGLQRLSGQAQRNADLLPFARAALLLQRNALRRLMVTAEGSQGYIRALGRLPGAPAAAAIELHAVAVAVTALQPELREVRDLYQQAVTATGAYAGDVERLTALLTAHESFAARLEGLAADLAAGRRSDLPAAREVGLESGRAIRLGEWQPAQMSQAGTVLRLAIEPALLAGRTAARVEFEYLRGAHGLVIQAARLQRGAVAGPEDRHRGWAGSGSSGNLFSLTVPPGAATPLELLAEVASSGGTDSQGEVWLLLDDEPVTNGA